jgi:hypothetical protein
VWRRQRERFHDANIIKHSRYGSGSITVWDGISRDGRTDFHVLERGTMTGVRYRDEILDVYVRPYASAVDPEFILMDDNARPHHATVVVQEKVGCMDWPARLLDLHPIEYVWNMLQVALSGFHALEHNPRLWQSSENALVEEWNNLPVGNIWVPIDSMSRR